jgi:GNAT superfamily N-acetyltransferase
MKVLKTVNGLDICEIVTVRSYKRVHHLLMQFHENEDMRPTMAQAQKNFRQARKEGYRLFALLNKEKAIGCIGVHKTHDPVDKKPGVTVNNLIVLPEMRGNGSGKILFDYAHEISQGAHSMSFWVDSRHEKLIAYYKSMGYGVSPHNIIMGRYMP